MSTRKEANRAEAIVRAVGGFTILGLLLLLLASMNGKLHSSEENERIAVRMQWVCIVILIGSLIGTGVAAWLDFVKKRRKN